MIGGAGSVTGFFARDLRNDVEMPMTDEEVANKTPPPNSPEQSTSCTAAVYSSMAWSRFFTSLAYSTEGDVSELTREGIAL